MVLASVIVVSFFLCLIWNAVTLIILILVMTTFLNLCSQKCCISLCSDLSRREVPAASSLAASHKHSLCHSWCPLCRQPIKTRGSIKRGNSHSFPAPVKSLVLCRVPGMQEYHKTQSYGPKFEVNKGYLCPFSLANFSGPEKSLTLGSWM